VELISRDSKLPFYQQLYEILHRRILRGDWQPGELLPSESDLIEQYQVSRITVRRAFDTLVSEGLIYRERGRGTFVAHPTVKQNLIRIVSFTEDMRQRGLTPGTRVLSFSLVPAPENIAEALQVEPGEELVVLERLRLADGEPMSLEQSHLVHRHCSGIMEHDFAKNPLRVALEDDYGIRIVQAQQVIRAVSASSRLATELSIKPKSALLHIERISFSQHGVPVEFLRLYHRGDRYALHNDLRG
jgi:GntR family transcriptional regulator